MFKNKIGLLFGIMIVSLFSIGVGYSALSTSLSVNGSSTFTKIDMIRITKLDTSDLNKVVENDKSFGYDNINLNIDINELNGSATYDVSISNLGQLDKIFTGINKNVYTNDLIKYELVGLNINDIIKSKEKINFKVVFKYKTGVDKLTDKRLNANLKFEFDDFNNTYGTYTIGFDSNGGNGTMLDQQIEYDEYQKINYNTFDKEGYYFKEWNTESDGSGITYRNGQTIKNLVNNGEKITLYAIWSENLESIYYPGDCKFNGVGKNIEGNCAKGIDNDYINTNIKPFSEDNYLKNFELKFTIKEIPDERFNANQRDTIFNILYEANDKIKGTYPGTLLRIENGKWQLQAGNGKNSNKILLNKDDLIGKEFRLIRYNDGNTIKIYYIIGNGELKLIKDITDLYQKFDTPLTIGAGMEIDNITSFRHAVATLSDISFEFINNDLNLNEIVYGVVEEQTKEELKTLFSVDGPCIFNGNNNISGNKCEMYYNTNYINTGIKLFSEEYLNKDFEINFTIDNYDNNNQNDAQVTLFNAFKERQGLGYGILLRRNNNNIVLILRNGINENKSINIPYSDAMSLKIIKKNNNVCYSLNNKEMIYAISTKEFADPFDVPVTFGGSIDKNGNPFRYIKGSMSNMSIKIGTLDDYVCGN